MSETVRATAGEVEFTAQLDFGTKTWTSQDAEPEGDFPFVAQTPEQRFELYSDHTFAEVER